MIPEAATEKELLAILKNYGSIKEFSIIKLGDKHCKGYGFCHYEKRQDAIKAIKSLNGKTFLHVLLNQYFNIGIICFTSCEIR